MDGSQTRHFRKAENNAQTAPAGASLMLEQARAASEFLKAFSHEKRLVILCLLLEGEKSVTELGQLLELSQPSVSQQLARLRASDLVEMRRDGKNVYYSLARPEVRDLITVLHNMFCPAQ